MLGEPMGVDYLWHHYIPKVEGVGGQTSDQNLTGTNGIATYIVPESRTFAINHLLGIQLARAWALP